MCYSAQAWAAWRRYQREFNSRVSLKEFVRLYGDRGRKKPGIRIPKAMDADFAEPQTPEEREIEALIRRYNAEQITKLEQEIFAQRKRLAGAERSLQVKYTKKADESRRIAGDKVTRALGRLDDLKRTELKPRDSRIFPGWYVPVMVWEDGARVVKPMRYQCRLAGTPASYDQRYPGTYNARRDNLTGYWREQFTHTHAVMVVNRFYENVSRHKLEHRELAEGEKDENVVLEFNPRSAQDMLIACLWSRWTAPGEDDLLSFAALTDEPPPEVAAAGHDRCIIQIKADNIDAWLNPRPGDLAGCYAILDDRPRPYYEHRLAA